MGYVKIDDEFTIEAIQGVGSIQSAVGSVDGMDAMRIVAVRMRMDAVDDVLDGLFLILELLTRSISCVAGRVQIQIASVDAADAAAAVYFTDAGKQMSAVVDLRRSLLFRPFK